tara:strand:- start:46 stop:231 length:186 start_codon:yes stop_codon:yes gene_type:complete
MVWWVVQIRFSHSMTVTNSFLQSAFEHNSCRSLSLDITPELRAVFIEVAFELRWWLRSKTL